MSNKLSIFLFLLISNTLLSQSIQEIQLYTGTIPDSKQSSIKEQDVFANGVIRIGSVVTPTLTKFTPAKANGISVIICPGGGYVRLAIDHEGVEVARAFNEFGITAFVLKYRLPSDSIMVDKTIGPLQDAQQAIRMVRKQAAAWGLNPNKIGIMGFSAGGHLASTASTHFNFLADATLKDTTSVRPDFSILIYPVISFNDSITHMGSKISLIGKNPSIELTRQFSNELQVTKNTPPTFLVQAGNDGTVPVENSVRYYEACIKNRVPVEMHLYPKGGHGFGLHNKTTNDQWFDRLITWMHTINLF
ncbi:MAG TPA: alpha/beta hydrolase [Chitinophagaceae bacterium]|nr:alpha/beta hydrolase [Chitinophagaceae bacterium]